MPNKPERAKEFIRKYIDFYVFESKRNFKRCIKKLGRIHEQKQRYDLTSRTLRVAKPESKEWSLFQ